jgi:hypothetical protein
MNPETFSIYGYISPEGEWFPLSTVYAHAEFAKSRFPNSSNPERVMDDLGWLRLSGPSDIMPGVPHIHCKRNITQAQQDKLFDWCEVAGEDYRAIVAEFNLLDPTL